MPIDNQQGSTYFIKLWRKTSRWSLKICIINDYMATWYHCFFFNMFSYRFWICFYPETMYPQCILVVSYIIMSHLIYEWQLLPPFDKANILEYQKHFCLVWRRAIRGRGIFLSILCVTSSLQNQWYLRQTTLTLTECMVWVTLALPDFNNPLQAQCLRILPGRTGRVWCMSNYESYYLDMSTENRTCPSSKF